MVDAVKLSLKSRAFIVSVLILASSVYGLERFANHFGFLYQKLEAPIRTPLKRLNQGALYPYKVIQIHVLQPEEEESLGTREYINWYLEDTSIRKQNDPLRYVRLFVSYYTGSPDPVPHVPDVCYLGAGYSLDKGSNDEFSIPELAALNYSTRVPFRALTFVKPGDVGNYKPTVVYTFGVNNELEADRNLVRSRLSKITARHTYFSKVEISFGAGGSFPDRDEAIEAAGRVFELVIPVLIEDHWPDLEALRRAEKDRPATAGGAEG